ncbi:MAG: transporter substrate-binding domain-containing protein [Bauldia sp.]
MNGTGRPRNFLAPPARRWGGGLRLRIAAALLGLSLAAPAFAQTPPDLFIPSFIDPHAHSERPPAGVIKSVRFAATDDFPPFSFPGADGRLTGYNVDLARAICRELGVPCTLEVWRFADIPPALAGGAIDAALAGIAVSADARQRLAFSAAYLRNAGRFVQRNAAPFATVTPTALADKRVAVVSGSAHEAFLKAAFPNATLRLYPNADDARAALMAGEADLHFGDGLALSFWLGGTASTGCCSFAGGPFLESRYFGEGLTIATARGAGDLQEALNAALEALQANGTLAELYLRYFPIGFY